MKNRIFRTLIFLVLFTFFCCKNNSTTQKELIITPFPVVLKYDSIDKYKLVEILNKNLENKFVMSQVIDSLVSQKNVKIIDSLTFDGSSIQNTGLTSIIHNYTSKTRKYSLKVEKTEDTSNTFFYDGKTVIDFSKHKVLSHNNSEYKSENFGFNSQNELRDIKIVQIAKQQFIYADVTFLCNGTSCGCSLNFIYNINSKKAFFIDNFRFGGGCFISDYNNDGVVDLFVVGRNINTEVDGLPISKIAYQLTWFEYINGDFKMKMNNKKPYTFEFIRYSTYGDEYADHNGYYSLKVN